MKYGYANKQGLYGYTTPAYHLWFMTQADHK